MTEHRNVDPRSAGLPSLEGGWELQRGPHVELWVPRQPDALFDPDAEIERRDYHASMPYWAWVWDAVDPCVEGLVKRGVKGRVLELGAGLGAVGLSLAKQQGATVTLSDYDPIAVAAMGVNVAQNSLEGTRVWALDWRDLAAAPAESFDFVVGCEVIYDPGGHGALLDAVERFLVPKSGAALIFDPGRGTAEQFIRRAKKRGFSVRVEDMAGDPKGPAPGEPRWLTLEI
jgi:predicted nicotinamide N-methyase